MFDGHQPWAAAPIFFAVVAATAAIASWLHPLNLMIWTATAVALIASIAVLAWRGPAAFRHPLMIAAISLVAAHAAVVTGEVRHPSHHPITDWLGEERNRAEFEFRVVEGPIFHDRGVSFDARLLSVDIDPEQRLTESPPLVRVFYPAGDLAPCSPPPMPGDRMMAWGQLERFAPPRVSWRHSHRRLMEGRGYAASLTLREAARFDDDPDLSPRDRLMRTLAGQRVALEHRLARHLDGDALAISMAMLTGSRGHLTPELREPFNITSTGHILAISGLHFAVIAGIVALLIRLVLDRFPSLYRRWPRRMIVGLITCVILLLYLLAIGAPVSARRAFGMTALAIGVICFSPWRLAPLCALAAIAGALLLVRPSLIAEAGYQLSVTATAGILLFLRFRPPWVRPPDSPGPTPEPVRRRLLRRLTTFAGLSLSATIATWPVLVAMTGELPIAGLWANLIVVPAVGSVLFPLLVVGALVSSMWPALAHLLLAVASGGVLVLHTVVDHLAYAPGSVLRWGTPSPIEVVGLFTACTIALVGGLRRRAVAIALCTAFLFATPSLIADSVKPPATKIHFLYVGQGDATLVELSDGTTVLIDGGGRPIGTDPGLQNVVPYLRHRGIGRLDAVVLTHGDYDHYGGLFATIRPFRPARFYVDADETTDEVERLRREMAGAGTEIHPVTGSAIISSGDVGLRIDRPDLDWADPNDRSLVVSFSYAGAGVVLPADLEAVGEQWLVDHLPGSRALLKVPHHGSNTSSSPQFLDHFSPAVAVASSGRHNRFGHPDPAVIDRYEQRDIDLFRTDRHGSVVATIDADGTISVRTAWSDDVNF